MPLSAGGSSCAFTSLSTGSAFATFNVDEEKSGGGIVLDLSPNVVVSISMSAMVFPALLSDRRCGLMLSSLTCRCRTRSESRSVKSSQGKSKK